MIGHPPLLSAAGSHLEELHGLGQDQLAIDALGGQEADLIRAGIQLVQAAEGAILAVSHPVVAVVTKGHDLIAAIADIKLPDGTEFSIVDTHIDMSKLDNGMSQIKEVNRIPQLGKHYIVAGDMNRRVGTAEINELSSVWTLALSREFDHIGYYPANGWVVKETKVFSDNQLSDHYPIMVTLEFVK